jgi:hypothetical protein
MVARSGVGEGQVDAARAAPRPTSRPQSTRRPLGGGGGGAPFGTATKRAARASAQSAAAALHAYVLRILVGPQRKQVSCQRRCVRCARLRVGRGGCK